MLGNPGAGSCLRPTRWFDSCFVLCLLFGLSQDVGFVWIDLDWFVFVFGVLFEFGLVVVVRGSILRC